MRWVILVLWIVSPDTMAVFHKFRQLSTQRQTIVISHTHYLYGTDGVTTAHGVTNGAALHQGADQASRKTVSGADCIHHFRYWEAGDKCRFFTG